MQRIEELAESFGSRAALAKAAGIKPNTLHSYVIGSEPPRGVLVALARAGRVSVEWLATGAGQKRAGLPEGYTAISFYDLKQSAGRIYPLFSGQPSEFLILKTSWLGVDDVRYLFALEAMHGVRDLIRVGDLLVIAPMVGIFVGQPGYSADDQPEIDGRIHLVAAGKAEAALRQLRWRRPGNSLIVLAPDSNSRIEKVVEIGKPDFYDFQILGRVLWRAGKP